MIKLTAFSLSLFHFLFGEGFASQCNEYLADVDGCILQTNSQCYWNQLTSTCISTTSTQIGCEIRLNRLSCLRQQLWPNGSIAQCYFSDRCYPANPVYLNKITCNESLSIYACLSVTNPTAKCHWSNGICQELSSNKKQSPIGEQQALEDVAQRCITDPIQIQSNNITDDILSVIEMGNGSFLDTTITQEPSQPTDSNVSSNGNQSEIQDSNQNVRRTLCQSEIAEAVNQVVCKELSIFHPCFHGGYEHGFKCIDMLPQELQNFTCDKPGINKYGCQSLNNSNISCIFRNGACEFVKTGEKLKCDMILNKQACLSIDNYEQPCRWNDPLKKCELETVFDKNCSEYTFTSVSTCSNTKKACLYDKTTEGCRDFNDSLDAQSCQTMGLSVSSCSQINSNCLFDKGCKQLQARDLQKEKCVSQLSKSACLNINTPGETCHWNSTTLTCEKLTIAQHTKCLDLQLVNGLSCQLVVFDGCKYSVDNHSCIQNDIDNDLCSTSFLNIQGCVDIVKPGVTCQWDQQQQICRQIQVIPGVTACSELLNVNEAACSKVSRPETTQFLRNCKYLKSSRGCVNFNQPNFVDKSNVGYVPITCEEPGLNVYGCVTVDTYDPNNSTREISRCKWDGQQCTTIKSQSQIQSMSCLSLQLVNAAACSWIIGKEEYCKYEPQTHNCIPSVNIYKDGCLTPGMNSYGCSALRGDVCYFDLDNSQCLNANDLTPVQYQKFLASTQCTLNFPSKFICLRITTVRNLDEGIETQTCQWDKYLSLCTQIVTTPKDQCSTYADVNPNTCSSIDPQIIRLESYCGYNFTSNSCLIQVEGNQPCATPGFNILSCSSRTDPTAYCYFDYNYNQCMQFGSVTDIKKPDDARKFFELQQIECRQLNPLGCPLNDWGKEQKCLFDQRCMSLDFDKDANKNKYTCDYFRRNGTYCNKWVCRAVTLQNQFCQYDKEKQICNDVTQAKCTDPDLNINACLTKTSQYQCHWDHDKLECFEANPAYLLNVTCDSPVNIKICSGVSQLACYFDITQSKCFNTSINAGQTKCSDFTSSDKAYSVQSCQKIDTQGQFCSYNSQTQSCQDQSTNVNTCNVPGFNKYSCFGRTTKQCYWDKKNGQCDDLKDSGYDIYNATCDMGVNKVVCLLIQSYACRWDGVNGVCTNYTVTPQTTLANLANYQHSFYVCTQMTAGKVPIQWDPVNQTCVEQKTLALYCQSPQMNKWACLTMTQSTAYCYWDVDYCATVQKTEINNYECSEPVNRAICVGQTTYACEWSVTEKTCRDVNVGQRPCSDFANSSTSSYSQKVCVNVNNPSKRTEYSASVITECKMLKAKDSYPDYCRYNQVTRSCTSFGKYSVKSGKKKSCLTASFASCNQPINVQACRDLTTVECVFTIENGCQTPSPTYTGFTCDQANSLVCLKTATLKQYCTLNETCKPIDIPNQGTCDDAYGDSLVNANACSALNLGSSKNCIYNEDVEKCVTANTVLDQYQCTTPGLNKAGCENLQRNCQYDVTNTICSGVGIKECSAAQSNSIKCAGVRASGQFCINDTDSGNCVNISDPLSFDKTCDDLALGSANINTCSASIKEECLYSVSENKCTKVTEHQKSCSNLNKLGCITKTTPELTPINCGFNIAELYCQQLTTADMANSDVVTAIGSCENLNPSACLKVSIKLPCKLDIADLLNPKCVNMTSLSGGTCSGTDTSLVNPVACSLQSGSGQYCGWDDTVSNCIDILANETAYCTDPGLNMNACIERTTYDGTGAQQECYWDSQQNLCQSVPDESFYFDVSCDGMNQIACSNNYNSSYACIWNSTDKPNTCSNLTKEAINCADYNATALTTSKVSAFVCAYSSDVACAFDNVNMKCITLDTTQFNYEWMLGINKIACLNHTQGFYFYWDDSDHSCNYMENLASETFCNGSGTKQFNLKACIEFKLQTCKFNLAILACSDLIVDNDTDISVVTDPTVQVGKIVCQNFVKGYVSYDSARFTCKDINLLPAKCTDEGLNRLGCLGRTSELCLFSEADGCRQYTEVAGRGCSPSGEAYNNINLCAAIQLLPCVYYKENDTCTNYTDFDSCSSIEGSTILVTNPAACASQRSDCAYNSSSQQCMTVTSLANGKCKQDGISKSACIKFTTENCIFVVKGDLQYCDSGTLDNYTCKDMVNKKNCLSIVTEDQTCEFDEYCKEYIPSETDDCLSSKLVNPFTCVKITKEDCMYDYQTNKCQRLKSTTKCDTPSLNKRACLGVTAIGEQCLWDDEFNECYSGAPQYVNCIDPVNIGLCTAIEQKGQYCYWNVVDSACQQAASSLTCSQLELSNVASSCAFASDPCMWNSQLHKCIAPTENNLTCSTKGLSKTACENNTKDKKTCLFDLDINACILPSFLTKCLQAFNEDDCAGVQAPCTWNKTSKSCDVINTTSTNCDDVDAVVSKQACGIARIVTSINTCAYDVDLRACYEKRPYGCSFSADSNSCTNLNTQPCLWNPLQKTCSLIFLYDYEGQYTCTQLGTQATQRTCVDLRRVGEYCIFKNGKCQVGDVYTDVDPLVGCNGYYNINFCLAIKGYQCFWSVTPGNATSQQTFENGTIAPIQIPYYIGQCKDANLSKLNCHQNLNFDTCINIKTPLQYCIWAGSNCTSVVLSKNPRDYVDLQTYMLVNSIVCTLVNAPGVFAKYDQLKSSCTVSNLGEDNCSTIGLNKAACLNLENFKCRWNREIDQCEPFDPTQLVNLEGCRSLNHVGSSVCQSVVGYACYFDAHNHMCQNATLDANCTTPGLSYLGCIQVKRQACEWKNGRCQPLTIIKDLTTCESFQNPINPISCALVDYFRQMCEYDFTTQKCMLINTVDQQKCDQIGMNQQLCQSIYGCIYSSGQCGYIDFKGAKCATVGAVHPQACSQMIQPVDTCKFDALTEKCGNPSINDVCSTIGLNQEACGSNYLCKWDSSANQCRCKLLDQKYPSCESYNRRADCISRFDCYFVGQKINSSEYTQVSFNITDYLVQNQLGSCKPITCQEMITPKTKIQQNQLIENIPKCLGAKDPRGQTCFQNGLTDTCQTINRCQQIFLNQLKYYGDCNKFSFNGIPCMNGTSTCIPLNCGNLLSEDQCDKYPSYCIFTKPSCNASKVCLDIQCEDYSEDKCNGTVNGRMCTYINGQCRGFKRCNELNYLQLDKNVTETICNQLVQGRQQCGWVTTNIQGTDNICSASPCRYMGSSISSCEGMNIKNQTCVLGTDSLCRACEEITDPCSCLQKQPLCGYDYKQSQCYSFSCNQITDRSKCTNANVQGSRICKYKKKTKQCVPQCYRIFSKSTCFESGCLWNDLDGQCDIIVTQRQAPQMILPSIYSALVTTFSIMLFMTIT